MNRKIIAALVVVGLAATAAYSQTATKYFVSHQGGYVGAATVTVGKAGEVVSASMEEWVGPGYWAEFNSPDGKSIVDGAVVRVPDPFGNTGSSDPQVKGYTFYIYNQAPGGPAVWSQYTPGKEGFSRPSRQYERDFEGLMSNPMRAEAYVRAAREDTLMNVRIQGTKVLPGKRASQTVQVGSMNKISPENTYFPLTSNSPGMRYNMKATIDFFKAHPTADYTSAVLKSAKIFLVEDKAIDANAKVSDYKAETDAVYFVADAVSGATNSDFQHYSLELQTAYKMALAETLLAFQK